MNTFRLGRLASISLASLLLVACDDDTTEASGSNGGSSSGATAGTTQGTSEGAETQSGTTTSDDSDGESSTAADTDSGATEGSDTDGDSTTEGVSATDGEESGSEEGGTDGAEEGGNEGGEEGGNEGGEEGGNEGGEEGGEEEGGGKVEICEAPGDLTPCDSLDANPSPFQAMGLGCEGGPNEVIPIFNPVFISGDDTAWRVITQYGTHIDDMDGLPTWRPREGQSMLLLASGQLPEPDETGLLTEDQTNVVDTNNNPDNSALPAPMSPNPGSAGGAGGTPFVNCDEVNDCSDSIIDQWNLGGGDANDLIWFQFETQVPGGTFGFSFDFAYFSEEFPNFVDTTFNDMFLAWSNSESYTGNLCFVNDEPCTVTALAFADDFPEFHGDDPVMEGTQYENNGGATGWFQANGTAVPGELLQLTFAVFDMGDTILTTSVLIDNFRWDCEGCTPSEVDPCIGIDPV